MAKSAVGKYLERQSGTVIAAPAVASVFIEAPWVQPDADVVPAVGPHIHIDPTTPEGLTLHLDASPVWDGTELHITNTATSAYDIGLVYGTGNTALCDIYEGDTITVKCVDGDQWIVIGGPGVAA